jgi:hypothetical protein
MYQVYAFVTNPSVENPPLIANIVDSAGLLGDDHAIFSP